MRNSFSSARAGFTFVEMTIMVVILGTLLGIAAPNMMAAREASRTASCINNLKRLDTASHQYALDHHFAPNQGLTPQEFASLAPAYLPHMPVCPSGGTYAPAKDPGQFPTCSVAATAKSADYQPGGRFYHGF